MSVHQKISILTIFIFTLFIGCTEKEKKPVQIIEFMNWESSLKGREFVEGIIKEFEEDNPGVKVENIIVSGGAQVYSSKLLTLFAGNSSPDIFETQIEWIVPLMEKGLLLNLDPYIGRKGGIERDDFFSVGLYGFQYDGKIIGNGPLYGLPKDLETEALIYNKDLFDKANLPYPERSLSWQEFLDIGKKLTIRDDNGHLVQAGIGVIGMAEMIFQNGGRFWSYDYKKCLLDSPEAIEAYQFVYDLAYKYKVTLNRIEIETGLAEHIGFKDGRVVMQPIFRYQIPDIERDIKNFRWGIAPFIRGKEKSQPLYGPSGYAISGKSQNTDICWRFMEYLVGESGQIKTAHLGWGIPSMKKIAYSEHFLYNPEHPEGVNKVFLDEMDYLVPGYVNPYIPAARVDQIFKNYLDEELIRKNEGGQVERAMGKVALEVNKEIQENLRRSRR